MNYAIMNFPWKHGYSKNFIDQKRANQLQSDFPEWDSELWNTHGKVFKSEYGYKKEPTENLSKEPHKTLWVK
jgi:hypothetical protein|tara:strand:- start:181 stop:396 length:216 start_codon:yes stop_codon:yes gene_type:complete